MTHKWVPLSDAQWVNIVNFDRAYESFSKDEAVHEAVKRTEAKLKELNEASAQKGQANTGDRLTDEKANRIIARGDYKPSGVVLCNKEDGSRCIIELSAVRWLDKDEMWSIMHPASGIATNS